MANLNKTILIGFGGVTIIGAIALAALVISNNQATVSESNISNETEIIENSDNNVNEEDVATETESALENNDSDSEPAKTYKIGDLVKLDGYNLTVVSFEDPYTNIEGEPIGGMKYLAVEVEYENTGSNAVTYSAYPWSIVEGFSEGIDSNYEKTGRKEPSLSLISDQLAPNSKVTGWITFRVMEDLQKYTLQFTPFAGNTKLVYFEVE
jgi:hypothetical protein